MKIIKNRKIFLSISLLMVAASIAALSVWGLNFGIDFKGGSLLEVNFGDFQPSISVVRNSLDEVGLDNAIVQPTEDSYIIRFKESGQNIQIGRAHV